MKANSKSLSDVIKTAYRFVIPEYQRPYIWTKEEIELLWNDLWGAFEDYKNEELAKDEEGYFLGPIVVAMRKDQQTGENFADVVDGQQRLTSFHSLLWIAFHKLSQMIANDEISTLKMKIERLLIAPDGKKSLEVAREDRENFLAIQENKQLDETKELGITGIFFGEIIAGTVDNELLEFLNYILNWTVFILVETESYSAAWELFIGLNGKGKPLTPADLIKAYACGTSEDSKEMADIWAANVLPLKDDSTSALLDITRVGTGEIGSDKKLFKMFEKAWDKKKVDASLIARGADIYYHFWHIPIEDIDYIDNAESARHMRGLRTLNRRDITPFLISFAIKYDMKEIFASDLLKMIESYQLWMAIRGKRGRERNFTALANNLYKNTISINDAKGMVADLIHGMAPSIEEVKTAIKNSAYRGRIMLFIVRSYEEGIRGLAQLDYVQYEHIMPYTPTDYWYSIAGTRDLNQYMRIVNNIGNIAPLDQNTNIVGSNDSWDVKQKLYKENVPNWLVAKIAREKDAWTPERISKRAEEITEWAVTKRWNLIEALSKMS